VYKNEDYLKNCNFPHLFLFAKILKVYIFFKYFPRRDFFSQKTAHNQFTLSTLFWKKKYEGHRIGKGDKIISPTHHNFK